MNEDAELVKKAKARAKHQLRMDKLGRVGRRRGVAAKPGTSRRGARAIKIRQREAQTLELRLKNYSYRQIGEQTGVGIAQAERDLMSALTRIAPRETAEQVFRLEVDRLDALASGHFDAACKGSIGHTHAMLRIIELRARLHGLLDHDRASAAARLVISQGSGDVTRRLEVQFVLPGSKSFNLDDPPPRQSEHQQHDAPPPQRIMPRDDDVTLERTLPSAWGQQHGSYGWLK
jgi:hypothetical protein